ncbi:MAG: LysR family transcriptional regulator [Nannocystales bacterium]
MLSSRDQHLLFVFAAVVRHKSFTAAAEELELTKGVVSSHVRTLEERLGSRLLERTTRRQRLTQLGEEVYATASKMVELNAELGALVSAQQRSPTGTLRVAAQTDLGRRFVTPVLAQMCSEHPSLDVDVHFEDREVDMFSSAIEVAVRLGVPKDSDLIAKKIADDQELILASPSLASAWSHAAKPSELQGAPWLAHREVLSSRETYRTRDGARSDLSVAHRRATASTVTTLIDLACAGVGFVVLPGLLVDAALHEGTLVRVLPTWRRRKVGVYAVRPSRRHTPARVTAFIGALTRAMR